MTKVAVLPVPGDRGMSYRAIAGDREAEGRTVGEAIDTLTDQLTEEESGTLIIVQNLRADRYFTAEQQQRLTELMGRWRVARDSGGELATDEQAELDALVDAELRASASRASDILNELSQ